MPVMALVTFIKSEPAARQIVGWARLIYPLDFCDILFISLLTWPV